VIRWKKGSRLDNGKPLPDAVVDDDVANAHSIHRQTGLETVNETVEFVLQCGPDDGDTAEEGATDAERGIGEVRAGETGAAMMRWARTERRGGLVEAYALEVGRKRG
jgi:hypothetical protein